MTFTVRWQVVNTVTWEGELDVSFIDAYQAYKDKVKPEVAELIYREMGEQYILDWYINSVLAMGHGGGMPEPTAGRVVNRDTWQTRPSVIRAREVW